MQVRSAATMGGNLALAKQQGLESDAATLLAALGARIAVVSIDNAYSRWVFDSRVHCAILTSSNHRLHKAVCAYT